MSSFRPRQHSVGTWGWVVDRAQSRTGCESHCLEALQVSADLFGRGSVVSPGGLRLPEDYCSHEREDFVEIEDIFGFPIRMDEMYVNASCLSPSFRTGASKATTVRIYNRVDDKRLACGSLQQDEAHGTHKRAFDASLALLLGSCRNTGLNFPRAGNVHFGAGSIRRLQLLGKSPMLLEKFAANDASSIGLEVASVMCSDSTGEKKRRADGAVPLKMRGRRKEMELIGSADVSRMERSLCTVCSYYRSAPCLMAYSRWRDVVFALDDLCYTWLARRRDRPL